MQGDRFETRRSTLLFDRLMTGVIKIGGALVITAVLGIFVFILWQILPLFRSARVAELKSIPLPAGKYVVLGCDEWGEKPFAVQPDGKILTADFGSGSSQEVPVEMDEHAAITAISYNQRNQSLALGTADGKFTLVQLSYDAENTDGHRAVTLSTKAEPFLSIGAADHPIKSIAVGDGGDKKLIAVIQDVDGKPQLHAISVVRKKTLLGVGKPQVDQTFDLSSMVSGKPVQVLVPNTANSVVVLMDDGKVHYLFRVESDKMELRQTFQPFAESKGQMADSVTAMSYLLGDVSIAFGSQSGETRVWSLFIPPGEERRLFGECHILPKSAGAPTVIAASLRNKAFLVGSGQELKLDYSTTDTVRWHSKLSYEVTQAALNSKYNRMVTLDSAQRVHFYSLDDPHPESGWKAIFAKLQYEGAPEKKWEWQSTGGSDDFEPKMSLMPLVFGTLKGTLYAMLFAAPIALLAALYTSQFMQARYRRFIKPTMEIMASLPSVVLGFLAALYVAPLLDQHVPSLLLAAIGVPLSAMLLGWGWSHLPIHVRKQVPAGSEAFVFLPLLILLIVLFWNLGPVVERFLFVVTDGEGHHVADFRAWWPEITHTPYEQRNSLVVGLMMGFAVIPIIFTIADDALSNVPASLKSASLALGASRWQTAVRVILPTASAGIFSAAMIGLGRAVGETMIVVMATGNTPIMDWNVFSGMRTLSANIAVELPEAPEFGTLYRMLFLGALALFVFTFLINTVAEVMRQHLRERYKTI